MLAMILGHRACVTEYDSVLIAQRSQEGLSAVEDGLFRFNMLKNVKRQQEIRRK